MSRLLITSVMFSLMLTMWTDNPAWAKSAKSVKLELEIRALQSGQNHLRTIVKLCRNRQYTSMFEEVAKGVASMTNTPYKDLAKKTCVVEALALRISIALVTGEITAQQAVARAKAIRGRLQRLC